MVQSPKLAMQASIDRLTQIEDQDDLQDQEDSRSQPQSSDPLREESWPDPIESRHIPDKLPNRQRASLWLKGLENDQDEDMITRRQSLVTIYDVPRLRNSWYLQRKKGEQDNSPSKANRMSVGLEVSQSRLLLTKVIEELADTSQKTSRSSLDTMTLRSGSLTGRFRLQILRLQRQTPFDRSQSTSSTL